MSQHDLPDPPQIPQPPRHVRLYVFQWIGLVALSVLPLSHVFERQAMYMYLYRGIAVYFAELLQTIGPNLKEVRPRSRSGS